MDWRVLVLLLLLIPLSAAAEIKIDGQLHYNTLEVTLLNKADREVSFTLQFQLKEKQDSWKLLQELPCSVNSTLKTGDSRPLTCNFSVPSEPGSYKIYARADVINGSFTYKDFLFEIGPEGFKETVRSQDDVMVTILSSPDKVKTGERFFVLVNVSSRKKIQLDVYSYVYNASRCYSLSGWSGGSERVSLAAGESRLINLTDSVVHEAVNGTYTLKVRARSDKDYDETRKIIVEQTAPNLSDAAVTASSGRESEPADSTGTDLFILALAPMLAILALRLGGRMKKHSQYV